MVAEKDKNEYNGINTYERMHAEMKKTLAFMLATAMLMALCSFAAAQEGDYMIFEGKKTAQGKDAMLDFYFTEHVGGAFDATAMTKGSKLVLEYDGPEKDGVYLALISHSGGNRWLTIHPNKVTKLENGRCQAEFLYISLSMKMGGLFNLLDEIRPLCASDEKVTLYSVKYVEGDGIPVNYGPSDWLKPGDGIAFLGDSITQNVYYNEGDFNTLLGREDCVNFGIGSQTSVHMLNRIDEIAARDYKQLVIWCGINDMGSSTPAQIAGRVEQMVHIMRETNPGIRFTIISTLPTTDAFFRGAQHKIAELNDLYRAFADANEDISFCDVYPYFLADNGYCKPELMIDGLHPNSEGYKILKEHLPAHLLPET